MEGAEKLQGEMTERNVQVGMEGGDRTGWRCLVA